MRFHALAQRGVRAKPRLVDGIGLHSEFLRQTLWSRPLQARPHDLPGPFRQLCDAIKETFNVARLEILVSLLHFRFDRRSDFVAEPLHGVRTAAEFPPVIVQLKAGNPEKPPAEIARFVAFQLLIGDEEDFMSQIVNIFPMMQPGAKNPPDEQSILSYDQPKLIHVATKNRSNDRIWIENVRMIMTRHTYT